MEADRVLRREIRESASGLSCQFEVPLTLRAVCLQSVSDWVAGRDPSEILGDLLAATEREWPEDYWRAFRSAVKPERGCKSCGGRGSKIRGYCRACYERHRIAGDFR